MGTKKKARWLSILISLGVSLGILVYLAFAINWRGFLSEMNRVSWVSCLPLVPILLASFWIRAIRWRYLLPENPTIPTATLYHATCLGFMGTCILPLRAGEFIRPLVLSRWQGVSFSTAFASIVSERVFDVLTLLAFFALCLGQIGNAPKELIFVARSLGVLALGILTLIILSYFRAKDMLTISRKLLEATIGRGSPHLVERLLKLLEEFIAGLRAISGVRQLAGALFYSVALWLLLALFYQVAMWSFGESPSFWVGITLNVMIALAVAAPSAPSFIGVFQGGCILALSVAYGYSEEFAVAYSVIAHGVQVVITILAGLISLNSLGFSFKELLSAKPETSGTELA